MSKGKINSEEKKSELTKYRDLVLATIDYSLEYNNSTTSIQDFDIVNHYNELKKQTEEHFQKGRLSILKKWFQDLIEIHIESINLAFNQYLRDRTNYNVDIFESFYNQIEKVIEKRKISNDNEFYKINILINQLSEGTSIRKFNIERLNCLLIDYQNKK